MKRRHFHFQKNQQVVGGNYGDLTGGRQDQSVANNFDADFDADSNSA